MKEEDTRKKRREGGKRRTEGGIKLCKKKCYVKINRKKYIYTKKKKEKTRR